LITVRIDRALEVGQSVDVEGDSYRHLCRARRIEVGAKVRVTDGAGWAAWSTVDSIDRKRARLVCAELASLGEPDQVVELWVGTLRSSRASWLVEKATEIGVHAVRFFASERAARSYGASGVDRLQRVASAALEQCHRAWCPPVTGVHSWDEVLDLSPGMFLDPQAEAGGELGAAVTPVTALDTPTVILVGPEGGWSSSEQLELSAAGHRPVGLGERILRVETAAIVGLGLLLLGGEALRSAKVRHDGKMAVTPGKEETS